MILLLSLFVNSSFAWSSFQFGRASQHAQENGRLSDFLLLSTTLLGGVITDCLEDGCPTRCQVLVFGHVAKRLDDVIRQLDFDLVDFDRAVSEKVCDPGAIFG
jgi:hypothetical protein